MNKLKIAVLDNGVDEKLLALCGLPDIIQQNKGIIRQLVNQYANKGLSIIAATANSGYTAFPASFSNVIGVKAKDTFNIDAEGLRDKGVDFAAPSEHKIWFGGNDITLQKSNSYAAPYVTAMAGRLMMEQS